MDALTVKNLTFSYPGAEAPTLKNISFRLQSGAFATLCGLSGSGKTTLLRQLKPALRPHGALTGEVLLGGAEVTSLSLREQSAQIGFVQQSPDNQLVTDKVWHELAFGLESLGTPQSDMRRRVAETAAFFGLEKIFEADVSTLSGGQKQLLNLASVMVMQPSLLLLDEPTSQLDPIAAADFLSCLHRVNRELGVTVLMIEHRLEDVLPLSDRVLVLENGELISDDTPQNTGANLKLRHSGCFLSMPTPMRVWDAAQGEGACPVTVAQGRVWLHSFAQSHSLRALPPEEIPDRKDSAVTLQNVWFRYEKQAPDVLQGLSLSVHHGEIVTILGGNGAGKSTLLSLINGENKPYRGKVISDKELCATLPQNPQSLLSGNSVAETLDEVLEGRGLSETERQERLSQVIALCELKDLLRRHPFDLSGGEMQKAALAKLLLLKPQILLLDEPTKGLDAQFKASFAALLKTLAGQGTAVLMVSHDVEFCASCSHRCVLLFHGEAVAEGTPRRFFTNNSFYVTSASRMARGVSENAVTAAELIFACTGQTPKPPENRAEPFDFADFPTPKSKPKLSSGKRLCGVLGAVLLVLGVLQNLGKLPFLPPQALPLWTNFCFIAAPVVLLMFSLGTLSKGKKAPAFERQAPGWRTVVSVAVVLGLIPATVYVGNAVFYDQKYLFISLLVLLECMLPFFLLFEGRRPQARELVLIAVMCALAVAGRAAFAALPQIKPVLALVILGGVAFGAESGFIIGAVSMLVSNIFFGQGAWTPWQMFAAGIIGFLAGIVFRHGVLRPGRGILCVFGFAATVVLYGGVMNFSSLLLSHVELNVSSLLMFYAQGLPYDIIHAFSTAAFLFFFAEPMLDKLSRVQIKYGLSQAQRETGSGAS